MVELVREQKSEIWHRERKTRITSSSFNDILSGTPNGWRRIIEEKEGIRKAFSGNEATRWGEKYETEAIRLFELEEDLDITPTGFWIMDSYPDDIGGSPDGLIGEDSIVEVKCPYNPLVHRKTFLEQKIPGKYIPQIQGNLMITGRRLAWFISYDPRAPIEERLVKIPIIRSDSYLDSLLGRVLQFVECWKGLRNPDSYFVNRVERDIFDDSIPNFF